MAVRRPGALPSRQSLSVAAVLLLPLLAGCSLLEPDHARVTIRFREVAPLEREGLVVNVFDGQDEWYVEGTDLEPAAGGWLVSRTLPVDADGQLRIGATLRTPAGSIAAAGSIVLPLDESARWRVDIFPSDQPQAEACGGCDGIQRFAIASAARPSAQDWLYITWTDPVHESPSATQE